MRRKYRISLKPPHRRALHDAATHEERALVELQRRLNRQFIERRDTGQNIEPVYCRLKIIERRLGALGVFW